MRSRARAVGLVPIAILVAACAAVPPAAPGSTMTPAATGPSEVAACRRGGPAGLEPVVAAGAGDRGALLLVARATTAGSLVRLTACLWERDAEGGEATATTSSTLAPSTPPAISIDRAVTTAGGTLLHLVAGRAARSVAAITVTLGDGSYEDAILSDGYWLAWWSGPQRPDRVAAFDRGGERLADTPFSSPSQ